MVEVALPVLDVDKVVSVATDETPFLVDPDVAVFLVSVEVTGKTGNAEEAEEASEMSSTRLVELATLVNEVVGTYVLVSPESPAVEVTM